jgi:hypothetical protein
MKRFVMIVERAVLSLLSLVIIAMMTVMGESMKVQRVVARVKVAMKVSASSAVVEDVLLRTHSAQMMSVCLGV